MSADIIRFIPRPRQIGKQTDFPTIAFRSATPGGRAANLQGKKPPVEDAPARRDPGAGHPDTAPCEFVQPDWYEK